MKLKKNNWLPDDEKKSSEKKRFKYQNDRIKDVFSAMQEKEKNFNSNSGKEIEVTNSSIMISRNDLFNAKNDLKLFVIQVLMWGYPTKGRGKNIENFLNPEYFDPFIEKLIAVDKNKNISLTDIKELLKNSTGLGFSTLSKILYFRKINYESLPALILDRRVINALHSGRFVDPGIEQFSNLSYENAVQNYKNYLKFMHSLAENMKTEADRVEMFLYEFGSNLKELIGEEGGYSEF